jgi:hypothetical protein
MGLTFLAFNRTVLTVEKGIKEGTAPITEETALLS